jgi:hypothetical protein
MKKFSAIKQLISGVLMLVILLPMTGCKKEDHGTPPPLPPQSSFAMDFSDFTDQQKEQLANETYINRAVAVLHVAFWNTVVFVHMAVPVATFKEAFNQQPQPQDDGSWLWSFNVNVGQTTFTAKLFGEIVGNQVEWEMYVSKSGAGAYEDFLWYSGTSEIGGTQGEWTLYKSPADPTPFVGIDWFKNEDGTEGITYTNIVPGGPENGGYISYEVTGNSPYDASYEIFNKGENNLVEINWNRETKAGQIRDPKTFSDEEFHCWNENGVDIECP